MKKIEAGCALLLPREKDVPLAYARVIFIDELNDIVAISLLPSAKKEGKVHHYIKKPKILRLSAVVAQIEAGKFYVADFDRPHHWLLTTSQLRSGSTAGLIRTTRRNTREWLRRQIKAYRMIRPFVENKSLPEILFDKEFSSFPIKRAEEIRKEKKKCTPMQVQRALNAYLLALGSKSGLLPGFANSGGAGAPKLSTVKTGRPREGLGKGVHPGSNCSERIRKIFELGWEKFKKPGVSVATAFSKTKGEWLAESVVWTGNACKVKLSKEATLYTEEQFEYWGKKPITSLSATQIENGETENKREHLRRQTKSRDKYQSLNGEAFLDSTSCDQTLVSEASRLKVLSSPWRTEIMGSLVDYIYGVHIGFESVSSTTALMAINHAAHSKIGYCAAFGVEIEERDWLSMTFSKFSLDNGEGKTQLVMRTLEEMECGAIFGPAYDAINKAPSESGHHRAHKQLDHLLPGSTLGRRARRGEPARAEMALLKFSEYIPQEIRRILHHNNIEIIRPPLIEMRQDGIEPTRRSAVEWLIYNGRMSSAPTDLRALQIHCLPRLKGFIDSGIIRLYDPTYKGKRIIPDLTYTNDWLLRDVAAVLAGKRRKYIEVHINPSDLTQCWCNLEGLQHLILKSADPDLRRMTLLDWLTVCADDRLKLFLSKVTNAAHAVNRDATIKHLTAIAKKEKAAEVKNLPKPPTKTEVKCNIRENTAVERSARTGVPRLPASLVPMGVANEATVTTSNSPLPLSTTLPSSSPQRSIQNPIDEMEDFMQMLRDS